MLTSKKNPSKRSASSAVVEKQRKIQAETDERDKSIPAESKSKRAAQTSPTRKPTNPLPKQHQRKPGLESELNPRPQFLAEGYKGSGKLDGKVAIVTGGDSGIGRSVAVLFAREGADVAIVYLSEEDPDAQETKHFVEKEGRCCLLIPGDVRDYAFCEGAVKKTVDAFGKLSVLVNNAAFQEHADSLEDITEEHFDLTLRTNLYGYFHMAKRPTPSERRRCHR